MNTNEKCQTVVHEKSRRADRARRWAKQLESAALWMPVSVPVSDHEDHFIRPGVSLF